MTTKGAIPTICTAEPTSQAAGIIAAWRFGRTSADGTRSAPMLHVKTSGSARAQIICKLRCDLYSRGAARLELQIRRQGGRRFPRRDERGWDRGNARRCWSIPCLPLFRSPFARFARQVVRSRGGDGLHAANWCEAKPLTSQAVTEKPAKRPGITRITCNW